MREFFISDVQRQIQQAYQVAQDYVGRQLTTHNIGQLQHDIDQCLPDFLWCGITYTREDSINIKFYLKEGYKGGL